MEGGGGEGGRWLEDEGGGDEKHSEDAVIIHEDDDQQIGSDAIQELLPEPPKSEDRGSNAKDFSDLLSDPDECIQDTCDGNGESETSDDLDVSNSDTINDVGLNDQEEYEDILPEYGDENASKNEDEDLDYPTTTAAIELEEDDKLMLASELENDYQDEEENVQNEEQQDPDYEYENESGSQDGSQEPEDSDPPLDETDEIINDEEQQFIAEEREILDYEETANDEEEDKEFEKQQLLLDESEQALGKELLEEKREDDIVQSLDYEEHDSFHEEEPIDDRSQTREQNNRLQLDKSQVEVIGNESAEENGKLRLNNQNIRRQATKNENRGHNPNSKLHNEVKNKSRNKLKHKSSSTESALQNQSPKLPSNINRPQANNSSNLSTKRLLQTHQGNPGRLTQNQVHHTKINKTKNHHKNQQQQQQQLNLQRLRRPVLRAQLVKSLRRVTGKNQGNSTDTKNKNSVSLEGTSLEHPIVMMSLLSGSYLKCPVCSKPDPKGLCRPVFWCGLWSITRAQA